MHLSPLHFLASSLTLGGSSAELDILLIGKLGYHFIPTLRAVSVIDTVVTFHECGWVSWGGAHRSLE